MFGYVRNKPIKKVINPTYIGFLLIENVPCTINFPVIFISMPTLNEFPKTFKVIPNQIKLMQHIIIEKI